MKKTKIIIYIFAMTITSCLYSQKIVEEFDRMPIADPEGVIDFYIKHKNGFPKALEEKVLHALITTDISNDEDKLEKYPPLITEILKKIDLRKLEKPIPFFIYTAFSAKSPWTRLIATEHIYDKLKKHPLLLRNIIKNAIELEDFSHIERYRKDILNPDGFLVNRENKFVVLSAIYEALREKPNYKPANDLKNEVEEILLNADYDESLANDCIIKSIILKFKYSDKVRQEYLNAEKPKLKGIEKFKFEECNISGSANFNFLENIIK